MKKKEIENNSGENNSTALYVFLYLLVLVFPIIVSVIKG